MTGHCETTAQSGSIGFQWDGNAAGYAVEQSVGQNETNNVGLSDTVYNTFHTPNVNV